MGYLSPTLTNLRALGTSLCHINFHVPGIDDHLPDEDVVRWEEFDEHARALRTGLDKTPVQEYLASPSAKQELFNFVQLIWKTEDIPADFVQDIFKRGRAAILQTIVR